MLAVNVAAYAYNGGITPANIVVTSGSLTLGPAAAGPATITTGGPTSLTGNVGAAVAVTVQGTGSAHANLTAAGPVVNNGAIKLESLANQSNLSVGGAGLTNNGTFAVNVGGGGGDNRRFFTGSLNSTASGTFTVDHALEMTTPGATHINNGTASVAGTKTLTVNGLGATLTNSSTISGAGTLVMTGAALLGTGSVPSVLLSSSASVSPGSSLGLLSITGNYVMLPGTALNIELAGPGAGVGYDQLAVTVNATLTSATLNVTTIGGFVPCNGATFDVVTYGTRTGAFGTVNAPAGMTVTYLPNILRLTSTTGAACQPGGKGLDIRGTASAVELTWAAGNNQVSYTLLRYNTATAAAELISIPANAVSHSHTAATDGTLYCYLLAANGPGATVLGLSDLLCGWKGAASGTVQARDFTLTMNQTTNATLTWAAPVGGADSYLLQRIPLDGSAATPVALGGGVTVNVQAVPVAGYCYQLVAFKGAGFGVTNTICGLPGFSTLSGVSLGPILSAVEDTLSLLSTNGGLQAFKPEGWLE